MPYFSDASKRRLEECHEDLRHVCYQAIEIYDFTVLCGHRGEDSQNEAYRTGRSRLIWPESKHNQSPSLAVDIAPWPVNWDNVAEFYYMAGVMLAVAQHLGVKLMWGGRWQKLKDCPHFELISV